MSLYRVAPGQLGARLVEKVSAVKLRRAAVAYPTDSGLRPGLSLPGNKGGGWTASALFVGSTAGFTFVLLPASPVGQWRSSEQRLPPHQAPDPGPWTFILKGTRTCPRMTLVKLTKGVRRVRYNHPGPCHRLDAPILVVDPHPARVNRAGGSSGWEVEDIWDLIDVVIEGPCDVLGVHHKSSISPMTPRGRARGRGEISLL